MPRPPISDCLGCWRGQRLPRCARAGKADEIYEAVSNDVREAGLITQWKGMRLVPIIPRVRHSWGISTYEGSAGEIESGDTLLRLVTRVPGADEEDASWEEEPLESA